MFSGEVFKRAGRLSETRAKKLRRERPSSTTHKSVTNSSTGGGPVDGLNSASGTPPNPATNGGQVAGGPLLPRITVPASQFAALD